MLPGLPLLSPVIELPPYITCKPSHPLEREAALLVASYLEKLEWPSERFTVTLDFKVEITRAGTSTITLLRNEPPMAGVLKMRLNHWCLVSRPKLFYSSVVPSEVAFADVARRRLEMLHVEMDDYGPEWIRTFTRLTDAPPMKPDVVWRQFDTRGLRLAKKQIAVVCACPLPQGLKVFGGKGDSLARFEAGQLNCKECGKPMVRAKENQIHQQIRDDMAYVKPYLDPKSAIHG